MVNDVRLVFEQRVVLSRYTLSTPSGNHAVAAQLPLQFNLTGPLMERCDTMPGQHNCGWGISLPVDRARFAWSALPGGMALVNHTTDNARSVAAMFVVTTDSVETLPLKPDTVSQVLLGSAEVGSQQAVFLAFAFGDESSESLAAALQRLSERDALMAAWEESCTQWERRWQQAFVPDNGHFSGNLPRLEAPSEPQLIRMYYAGALSMVSLERTNLPRTGPRVYTISQGNPSQLSADSSMGGAGQFTWDLSFTAYALSLLDPEATKHTLRFVVSNTRFPGAGQPLLVPQYWDVYSGK